MPDFDKTCFVIMPFGNLKKQDERCKHFNAVYDNIKMAVTNSGVDLRCIRADEINKSGNVNEDIIKYLNNSKMVIADISEKNPNVTYELGIRHSLKQNTILIAEDDTILPFDFDNERTIFYDRELQLSDEVERLSSYVVGNSNDSNHKDSPVLKVIGSNLKPIKNNQIDIIDKLNKKQTDIAYKHIDPDQYLISCLMFKESILSHIAPIEEFNDKVFESFEVYRKLIPTTRLHCKQPISYLDGVCFEYTFETTKVWIDFNVYGAVSFEIITNKYGDPPRLINLKDFVDLLVSIMKLGISFFKTCNFSDNLKISTLLDRITKVPLYHREFNSFIPFNETTSYEDNNPFFIKNSYIQDNNIFKNHIIDILKILLRLHNFNGNPIELIDLIYDSIDKEQSKI